MSRASRQSLVMLACIAGVFKQLHNQRFFSRVDIHRLCDNSNKLALDIIGRWRQDSSDYSTCLQHLAVWHREIANAGENFSAISWVYVASRLLADLQGKCTSHQSKKLLKLLEDPIAKLENFVDPTHGNWIEMNKADGVLDKLYEIIGWEW